MHLQVYIDTNVYLNLLGSQAVVPEGLAKFRALCENASIQVLLPQQTEEEYLSNREDVIASTIEALRAAKSIGGLPPLIETHSEGETARSLRRKLAATDQGISEWYAEAASCHALPMDEWFAAIKKASVRIPSTPELRAKAAQRAASHLPPGKGEALGDRLIWEALLSESGFCDDIHIITKDGKDYRSPLKPDEARKSLQVEWEDVNWGKVHIYESIDDFLSTVSETPEFTRAAEIGRAIWVLNNQSEEESINSACGTVTRYIQQISSFQATKIGKGLKVYYDRVFLTSDTFDALLPEFYRLYAKHIDEKDRNALSAILAAAGVVRDALQNVANNN
ncbi:PIN domain-containing protein [Allosphingosinicella sp.]|uniref:PIN domain-containing protein n=1 Tax=Allosphingosinicella sp. TaxID=2823234 RepID=UPI003784A76B